MVRISGAAMNRAALSEWIARFGLEGSWHLVFQQRPTRAPRTGDDR